MYCSFSSGHCALTFDQIFMCRHSAWAFYRIFHGSILYHSGMVNHPQPLTTWVESPTNFTKSSPTFTSATYISDAFLISTLECRMRLQCLVPKLAIVRKVPWIDAHRTHLASTKLECAFWHSLWYYGKVSRSSAPLDISDECTVARPSHSASTTLVWCVLV